MRRRGGSLATGSEAVTGQVSGRLAVREVRAADERLSCPGVAGIDGPGTAAIAHPTMREVGATQHRDDSVTGVYTVVAAGKEETDESSASSVRSLRDRMMASRGYDRHK